MHDKQLQLESRILHIIVQAQQYEYSPNKLSIAASDAHHDGLYQQD